MSGLSGYRRRLAQLLREKEFIEARIADLAKYEDQLSSVLVEAIDHHGDDFDAWWRDYSDDPEAADELRWLLNRIAGRELTRQQVEHRLEAAWEETARDLETAAQYNRLYQEYALRREDVA